jgi:hypothetical protein
MAQYAVGSDVTPLSIPKHGASQDTFPLESQAFHDAPGGKVLGICEGNDPFSRVPREEVIYQERDRFLGIALSLCAGHGYSKPYFGTGQVGIWVGDERVADKTHHLPSGKSLSKQQSRFTLEQAGLLIRLAEQWQVVQLKALKGSPQPFPLSAPFFDHWPVLVLDRPQQYVQTSDHPLSPALSRVTGG